MRRRRPRQSANGILKRDQRREVRARLVAVGARAVYAGYLAWADGKVKRDGTPYKAHGIAGFRVQEIFGRRPPFEWRDEVEPERPRLDEFLIEEWEAVRQKPPRRKIRLEKAAPLLERIEKPPLVVDKGGFVSGTLMRPEDWEVYWR